MEKKSILTFKTPDGSLFREYSFPIVKNQAFFDKKLKESINAELIYPILVFANLDNPQFYDALFVYIEDYGGIGTHIEFAEIFFDYLEPEYYYTDAQKQEMIRIFNHFDNIPQSYRWYEVCGSEKLPTEWQELNQMSKKFLYDAEEAKNSLMDSELSKSTNIHLFGRIERNWPPYDEANQLSKIIDEYVDWAIVWDALLELEKLNPAYIPYFVREIVLFSLRSPTQKSQAWNMWAKYDNAAARDWLNQYEKQVTAGFNFILKHADETIIFDYSNLTIKNPILFRKNLKRKLNAQLLSGAVIFSKLNDDDVNSFFIKDYLTHIINNWEKATAQRDTIFDYLEPEYKYTAVQKQVLASIHTHFLEIYTPDWYLVFNNRIEKLPLEWQKLHKISKNFLFDYDKSETAIEASIMDYELAEIIELDEFFEQQLLYFPTTEKDQLVQIVREHPDWDEVWAALLELETISLTETINLAKKIVLISLRTPLEKSLAWRIWVKHDKENAIDWLTQCEKKIDIELLNLISSAN